MPTMSEVRAKFPQYNDMSDADLASALHGKFYSDMPLADFHKAIGYKGESPDPAGIRATPERGMLETAHNVVTGVNDAVTQGATFGFADEIGAGMRAGARWLTNRATDAARAIAPETTEAVLGPPDAVEQETLSQSYDRALADQRAGDKQFAEEHPVLSVGGNIAGGLLAARPTLVGRTPVPVAGQRPMLSERLTTAAVTPPVLPGPLSRLQPIVNGSVSTVPRRVAAGAGLGAAGGAAGGFGGAEGGFENRLSGAGTGALTGGILGAGLPAVAAAGSKALGILGNVTGLRNDKKLALDHLNRAIRRDETTPTAIQSDMSIDPRWHGKPRALVDTGTSTRRLGRSVEVVPGTGSKRAQDFLDERQLGQQDRVTGDITTRLAPGNFYDNLDQLNLIRRRQAAPLYEQAYNQPFVWSQRIEKLLDRPSTRQALVRARRIAEEEGVDPNGLGLDLDAAGNVKIIPTAANMKTLDYVKRGLDDVVEQFRDPVTGKLVLDESGLAIDKTRNLFRREIDHMNPVYAQARAAWGGPSQTMEAMHLGRAYARGDEEAVIERFRALSPGDQDAFRMGVARELTGKVQGTTDMRDSVQRIFGSPLQRARLQALFPDMDSFRRFEAAMKSEQEMQHSRRVVTGNSVTGRIAADQDDASALTSTLRDFAGGGWTGALWGGIQRVSSKSRGLGEKSADELSKMLFTSRRADQVQILEELRRRQELVDQHAAHSTQLVLGSLPGATGLLGQAAAPDKPRRSLLDR